MKPVISVQEARKILGKDAENMSDEEISELITTLDILAVEALRMAKEKRMKDDALALANLAYDVYKDKNSKSI